MFRVNSDADFKGMLQVTWGMTPSKVQAMFKKTPQLLDRPYYFKEVAKEDELTDLLNCEYDSDELLSLSPDMPLKKSVDVKVSSLFTLCIQNTFNSITENLDFDIFDSSFSMCRIADTEKESEDLRKTNEIFKKNLQFLGLYFLEYIPAYLVNILVGTQVIRNKNRYLSVQKKEFKNFKKDHQLSKIFDIAQIHIDMLIQQGKLPNEARYNNTIFLISAFMQMKMYIDFPFTMSDFSYLICNSHLLNDKISNLEVNFLKLCSFDLLAPYYNSQYFPERMIQMAIENERLIKETSPIPVK